jgi:hypothetical protein
VSSARGMNILSPPLLALAKVREAASQGRLGKTSGGEVGDWCKVVRGRFKGRYGMLIQQHGDVSHLQLLLDESRKVIRIDTDYVEIMDSLCVQIIREVDDEDKEEGELVPAEEAATTTSAEIDENKNMSSETLGSVKKGSGRSSIKRKLKKKSNSFRSRYETRSKTSSSAREPGEI